MGRYCICRILTQTLFCVRVFLTVILLTNSVKISYTIRMIQQKI